MVTTRELKPLAVGSSFSRFLICLAQGGGDPLHAAAIAAEHCLSTPNVEATLKGFAASTKTMVGPAMMSDALWLGALSQFDIGAEAFSLLQSNSLYGRLASYFRRVP